MERNIKKKYVTESVCCIAEMAQHYKSSIRQLKKKQWYNSICSHMDGPGDYQNKWSKPDKDTNELIYETETDSQKSGGEK